MGVEDGAAEAAKRYFREYRVKWKASGQGTSLDSRIRRVELELPSKTRMFEYSDGAKTHARSSAEASATILPKAVTSHEDNLLRR